MYSHPQIIWFAQNIGPSNIVVFKCQQVTFPIYFDFEHISCVLPERLCSWFIPFKPSFNFRRKWMSTTMDYDTLHINSIASGTCNASDNLHVTKLFEVFLNFSSPPTLWFPSHDMKAIFMLLLPNFGLATVESKRNIRALPRKFSGTWRKNWFLPEKNLFERIYNQQSRRDYFRRSVFCGLERSYLSFRNEMNYGYKYAVFIFYTSTAL